MRPASESDTVVIGGGGGATTPQTRSLPTGRIVRWSVIIALAVLVPLLVERLPEYYLVLCVDAAIAAILLRSLGILIDRAGLLAICPLAFAGVGAYTVGWCNVHGWPGGLFLWMFLGGVASIPIGLLVALPALRVRGINLAVITLSFGAAIASLMLTYEFPGYETENYVQRPSLIVNDGPFFVLTWGVFVAICIGIWLIERRPFGTAWRCVARSERATAAMGMSVVGTKLGVFAISAFVAGIAGALMVGQVGVAVAANFDPVGSLALFAAAVLVGTGNPEGAVMGGIFYAFMPEILRDIGISQDFSNIFFGVGAVQALSLGTSVSGGWRRTARKLVRRRRERNGITDPPPRLLGTPPKRDRPDASGGEAMRISNLTVRYGNVVALNDVSLVIPDGVIVGLIGPNGAGKSTLVDAVSGFIRSYEGTIALGGESIDGLTVHRRARAGVRRTFQHERTVPELTVAEYMRLAARRRISDAEISDLLAFVEGPSPRALIEEVDVGSRRLVEIAGCLASQPRVLLLDEPTAGLAQAESLAIAHAIARMPERYGCSVLLIEHDMEVVIAACNHVTVLDFGSEIASGSPSEVLQHGAVISAYLGDQAAAVG